MARTNINPVSRQNYLIPDSLSQNSGIITAVVFGQSYTVSIGSPTANTLYFLYLLNGSLVSVTTVPSTYRGSNPSAILVGAYYSNGVTGSIGFGSFCTIEGVPTTSQFLFTPTGAWTSNITYSGFLERRGDRLKYIGYYLLSGAPNATQHNWNMPTNLTLDTTRVSPNFGAVGVGTAQDSGVASYMGGIQLLSGLMYLYVQVAAQATGITNTAPVTWGNADSGTIEAEIPIVGWSEKPLKDL